MAFGTAAQAATSAGPIAHTSNAVAASVRSVQPAVSGLFQVHAPRAWVDVADESGVAGPNGVPDFLDSWEAFGARTSSAILKNGYAFTTIDALGHEVLYAGVKRTSSKGPSSVLVEFSQQPGERTPGDLRISAALDAAGSVEAVRFESYSGESKGVGKFLPVAFLGGEGCSDAGTACIVANGALLEIGYNLTDFGRPAKEFSGIRIGTPEEQESGTIRILAAHASVDGGCVKEVGGVNNPTCTAGDVRLASVKDVVILSGDTCNPNVANDTITIQSFTGIFTSGPQRYDIGSYVATDGGGADGARSGSCTRVAFQNNTTGLVNLDNDSCADIAANQAGVEIPLGPITIKCVDAFQVGADGNPAAGSDGNIDFFHCETWAQQANEIICNNSSSVKAGTPSKCGCSLTGAAAGFCVPVDDGNACTTEVCQGNCQTATGGGSNSICSSNADCTGAGETCRGLTTRSIPVQNGTSCGSDPNTENPCDLAPTCQAGSCTAGFAPDTTVCRAQNGECDVADFCTGSSATCSTDAVAAATTTCTDDGNVCTSDVCDGTLKTCTHPAWPDGPRTGCNAAGDQCNEAQLCVSGTCQAGGPKPNGTDCEAGASGGLCDDQDECEGGTCIEKYKSSATSCRGAAGVCDIGESCTGSSADCPSDAKSTAECRGAAGFCDLPESCDGTNNDCPADGFKTNAVECRASAGVCDLAESCTGDSATCPTDAFQPATVVCRARVNSCDADEYCSGNSATCGPDVCLGGDQPISYP